MIVVTKFQLWKLIIKLKNLLLSSSHMILKNPIFIFNIFMFRFSLYKAKHPVFLSMKICNAATFVFIKRFLSVI